MTGSEFRAIRLRLGYSLRALAERLGVDRDALSRAEKTKGAIKPMLALAIRQIEQEEK